MANWYGFARSNYFRVKDRAAFDAAIAGLYGVEVVEGRFLTGETDGTVALLAAGTDDGAFPSIRFDEDTDEVVEIDVPQTVSEHLVPGQVAIFQTVGAEKLRYLTGHAIAINSAGETRAVNIDDIYALARELGEPVITSASY